MPRKRSISTLQEMCLETAYLNLNTIKQKAKSLPAPVLDKFYERCCDYVNEAERKFIRTLNSLPSDLFISQKSTELLNSKFDLKSTALSEKILRNCKNLKRIDFPFNSHSISPSSILSIITNNPSLTHLDLRSSRIESLRFNFLDSHLLLINKLCPHLKYLNVENMKNITDLCIESFPVNLLFLNVNYTSITPTGCLAALNRLKSLKELKYIRWIEVMDLFQLPQHVTSSFPLESLEIVDNQEFTWKNTFNEVFPNLRDIRFVKLRDIKHISSLIKNKKGNLITRLDVHLNPVSVAQLGRFFPRLEELVLRPSIGFRNTDFMMSDVQFTAHIPFEHLKKLKLYMFRENYRLHEFKLLLANFVGLKSLEIEAWNELDDEMIFDVVAVNLLESLESVNFKVCPSVTVASLIKLLNSLDYLKVMDIYRCQKISDAERGILEKLIDEMQWDVNLFVSPNLFWNWD